MLDHMSSTGVMHGDGRRRGEERVIHERKKENIAAVHTRYHNRVRGMTRLDDGSAGYAEVEDEWLLEVGP